MGAMIKEKKRIMKWMREKNLIQVRDGRRGCYSD